MSMAAGMHVHKQCVCVCMFTYTDLIIMCERETSNRKYKRHTQLKNINECE